MQVATISVQLFELYQQGDFFGERFQTVPVERQAGQSRELAHGEGQGAQLIRVKRQLGQPNQPLDRRRHRGDLQGMKG